MAGRKVKNTQKKSADKKTKSGRIAVPVKVTAFERRSRTGTTAAALPREKNDLSGAAATVKRVKKKRKFKRAAAKRQPKTKIAGENFLNQPAGRRKHGIGFRLAGRTRDGSNNEQPDMAPAPISPEAESRLEKEKNLIMWSGVIFFMLLIVFVWAFNARTIFERSQLGNATGSSTFNWNDLKTQIDANMTQMQGELSQLKAASTTATSTATTATTATATYGQLPPNPDIAPGAPTASLATSTPETATATKQSTTVNQNKLELLKEKVMELGNAKK